MANKILWLDTETTGLYPKKHCLIQVAGIAVIDGKEVGEFNYKCKPAEKYSVNEKALQINNLTRKEIYSWPEPDDVCINMVKFMRDFVDESDGYDKFVPAGYNVQFDLNFIKQLFEDFGNLNVFSKFVGYSNIDILNVVRWLKHSNIYFQDIENCKLKTVVQHCRLENFNAHDALSDVRKTKELAKLLENIISVNSITLF